jgi:signal transduction histidine kinase
LFWRFAAIFGSIMLLITAGVAVLAVIFTRLLGGGPQAAVVTWFGVCGLLVVLPMILMGVARTASRNITSPLADVMAAADAVASGDLDVRVPERSHSEFGKLARTFNRMVGELQRSDEQRRDLTADVAHELRTPLHIIQGNLEGILDGVYQPTAEHIQTLLEETQILSRLVEDLRTLSLAESGHLPLHKEQVQVAELLADLATSFSGQAGAAGIALRVESEGLSGKTVEADVMRLNQVLANLLVNALRYTPPGGAITLRGEPSPIGVRLIVSDTGEGIPPDDLAHIFDRFWRGDPARTRKDGTGGGLGLAIVRQLVELHGGRVSVESAPGQGTVFTIDLPDVLPD